ncbi:MAG: transposase [Chloroflexota bacterium]|nr:transposase [Chloroflexota bacterium]MBI5703737.1 transposase [Chloroflexota bacterium]
MLIEVKKIKRPTKCSQKPSHHERPETVSRRTMPNESTLIIKIDSPPGRKIYAGRLKIVEPVFANICFHKRMNRFTLRTKPKVDVQWMLYAIVHNIGKIHAFRRLN